MALIHHVDNLHVLPVGLRHLHLFDALGDPVALSRLVRGHADADPHKDHHQDGHHCDTSTHRCLLRLASVTTMEARCEALVKTMRRFAPAE